MSTQATNSMANILNALTNLRDINSPSDLIDLVEKTNHDFLRRESGTKFWVMLGRTEALCYFEGNKWHCKA